MFIAGQRQIERVWYTLSREVAKSFAERAAVVSTGSFEAIQAWTV